MGEWLTGGFPEGDGWPFGDEEWSSPGVYIDHARMDWPCCSRDEWHMIVRYRLNQHQKPTK